MISGYEFYKVCDASIDDRYPIKTSQNPTLLFLKYGDISSFLKNPFKVNIVYHNSDESFTNELASILKPYCERIYAVNCVADNVQQIPLGLRDDAYTPHSDLQDILMEPEQPRNIFCYANFLLSTNVQERLKCFQWAQLQSWVTTDLNYIFLDLTSSLNHSSIDITDRRKYYWWTLRQCKFVLCPPGTGLDTHRVYESLMCGAIPIVLKSPISQMQANFGAMVINSWDELTEETCRNFVPVTKKIIEYTAKDILDI